MIRSMRACARRAGCAPGRSRTSAAVRSAPHRRASRPMPPSCAGDAHRPGIGVQWPGSGRRRGTLWQRGHSSDSKQRWSVQANAQPSRHSSFHRPPLLRRQCGQKRDPVRRVHATSRRKLRDCESMRTAVPSNRVRVIIENSTSLPVAAHRLATSASLSAIVQGGYPRPAGAGMSTASRRSPHAESARKAIASSQESIASPGTGSTLKGSERGTVIRPCRCEFSGSRCRMPGAVLREPSPMPRRS